MEILIFGFLLFFGYFWRYIVLGMVCVIVVVVLWSELCCYFNMLCCEFYIFWVVVNFVYCVVNFVIYCYLVYLNLKIYNMINN